MSKKLEVKQRRRAEAEAREAERKRAARRRNLVTGAIALLVIGAVAAAIAFQGGGGTEDIGGAVADAGCDEIETFDEAQAEDAREHVEVGQDVQYETTPGVYGAHWPPDAVSPPGFFEEPIEEERLVHNMEHSQIILYYSPDISDETKTKIEDLVDQQGQATVAAPYDGLEKPFVIAAWGAMQACDEPVQAVVDAFRERFQGRGPEPLVPTFEG
jgi:hypothetical protein